MTTKLGQGYRLLKLKSVNKGLLSVNREVLVKKTVILQG
jgi:hypothetical protein